MPNQRNYALKTQSLLVMGYLIAGAIPLTVGVVRPGITGWKPALIEDLIYGRAARPYVKRQLIPTMVRGVIAVTPATVRLELRNLFAGSSLIQRLQWPVDYAAEISVTLAIMYGCLVGGLVAVRRFMMTFLTITSSQAHFVTLAVACLLPLSLSGKMYFYDWGVLLLFTTALILMFQRRWSWYYPVFVLACFNKETSILLPVILAGWQGRQLFRGSMFIHVVIQTVIAVAIASIVAYLLRNTPGGDTEWHLERNLAFQLSPLAYFRLVLMAMGITLALWNIREAPAFLQRGYGITLAVLLGTMLFIGYIDELRDMYEILGFTLVLTLHTLGKRWGIHMKPALVSQRP